jgi:tetraacyldisaccharide 4'-kinase
VKRLPLLAEAILIPLAWLYSSATRFRNLLFDDQIRQSKKISKPVISIGNLTAGGTGKTPITAFLIENLSVRLMAGRKTIGIVSRGYGGRERGPVTVAQDGSSDSASRFGDEPTWLAQQFPQTPVVVGRDRVAACNALLRDHQVALIIADDAFQHRRLRRDLDIVLLDATEPRWHYSSLPLGRLRENFTSLERAQVIFLTKVNLAEATQVAWLRERCRQLSGQHFIAEFESRILALMPLLGAVRDQDGIVPASLRNQKVMLVSAIGRPTAFRDLFEQEAAMTCVDHLVFADHHAFNQTDCQRMAERARALTIDVIVITEKDAIKLKDQWTKFIAHSSPALKIWVTRLEMRPKEDLAKFYEVVARFLI